MDVATAASRVASFAPEPVSVREARRFLQAFLDQAAADEALADAAELALSEVVTNALLHAHTPFDVQLSVDGDGALRVEVRDASPLPPRQRAHEEQATTGRGMSLVAAYTHECGVTSHGADGKTVWFVVAPGGSVQERTGQDALDAWDLDAWDLDAGDPEPGTDAGTVGVVVLRGFPPTLWLAGREHHDAVLRELALYGADHPEDVPPPAQIALADQARAWIATQVFAELDRLAGCAATPHRVLPLGHPSPLPDTPSSFDLHIPVPHGGSAAFGAVQDVLDCAEELAVAGALLARPGLPEVIALRDWACEQAIAQRAGGLPSPWPGSGQDRFTRHVRDRQAPDALQWDVAQVADSDRGVVAADETNRIVAISRPLADALGWAVQDLVGRRVVVLIPPELREAHVAGFTRHLTTGQAHVLGVPLRLPVLRADGSRVECHFLIERSAATTGRSVYVAWIEPDSTRALTGDGSEAPGVPPETGQAAHDGARRQKAF